MKIVKVIDLERHLCVKMLQRRLGMIALYIHFKKTSTRKINDSKRKIQINKPPIKKKNQEANLKMDFRVNKNQVIYTN